MKMARGRGRCGKSPKRDSSGKGRGRNRSAQVNKGGAQKSGKQKRT